MLKVGGVVFGALLLLAGGASAEQLPVVDRIVEPEVGVNAPGIAVLVMRGGEVLHIKGYGFADIEAETPVDENTLFDLASVSKQMTALAAMMLIEEGTLAPDTPVAEVLPAFEDHPYMERPLVVSDLVHHIGGLPDYLDGSAFEYSADMENEAVVAWLGGAAPLRPPGEAFEYSNSGYVLLGSLVAAADGKDSLADVLEERIWDVLGMDDTALVTPADADALAEGYEGTEGDFTLSRELTVTEGDGNVYTSIAEMALFEAALAQGRLLDKRAMAALFRNGVLDDGGPVSQEDGDGYGFGWNLLQSEDTVTAYHSGSWFGTSTAYVRVLGGGPSVIVLANGENLEAAALAFEIAAAVQ